MATSTAHDLEPESAPAQKQRCYALWMNRNGQRLWAGPFPDNVAARTHLQGLLDTSGGSMITTGIPMTPGEVREAAPLLRGDSYAMPGHSTMPRSERVTDTWSGDREHLIASFGDLDLPVEQHEHAHHDGCYFTHAHENGQERHGHTYVCRDEGCHHIMMQEVS